MPILPGGEEVNQLEKKSWKSDTGRGMPSPTPKGLVICLCELFCARVGYEARREREGEATRTGWYHLL